MSTDRISSYARGLRQHLRAAWMSIQVEFQGRYSVDRVEAFASYSTQASLQRMLLVCMLTPVPCLVLALLVEAAPLAPPEDGVYLNWVFFIRVLIVSCGVVGSMTLQMGQMTPRLEMKTRQAVVIGLLSGIATAIAYFALAMPFVFPVPFGLLLSSQLATGVFFACCTYTWGSRWRADPLLREEVKQQITVLACQLSLTLIYPLYMYAFASLDGVSQSLFVVVLPAIKIMAKNWISRALADRDDPKPQEVIFNVEIFNALYVANAIQKSSSIGATVTVMVVDLVHLWVSMVDVMEILKEIQALLDKIPLDHPVANEDFIQITIRLLNSEMTGKYPSTELILGRQPSSVDVVKSFGNTPLTKVCRFSPKILPKCSRSATQLTKSHRKVSVVPSANGSPGLDSIFTKPDRDLFVSKSARLLFILEYIVLGEYVEVVLPMIYCLHKTILFNMPNKAYYPSLATSTSTELMSSISNVLGYGALELASLVFTLAILRRSLGFSSLSQLSFVLDKQANKVQTKMMILFTTMMSFSLVHFGYDLSFKFAWVHTD